MNNLLKFFLFFFSIILWNIVYRSEIYRESSSVKYHNQNEVFRAFSNFENNFSYSATISTSWNEGPDWIDIYFDWIYKDSVRGTSSKTISIPWWTKMVQCYSRSDSSVIYWNTISCKIESNQTNYLLLNKSKDPWQPTNLIYSISSSVTENNQNEPFWAYTDFLPNWRYVIEIKSSWNEWPDWVNLYINGELTHTVRGTNTVRTLLKSDLKSISCVKVSDSSNVYWNSVTCNIYWYEEPFQKPTVSISEPNNIILDSYSSINGDNQSDLFFSFNNFKQNEQYMIVSDSSWNEWPDWVDIYVNDEIIWTSRWTSQFKSRILSNINTVKCYKHSDSSIVYWNSINCKVLGYSSPINKNILLSSSPSQIITSGSSSVTWNNQSDIFLSYSSFKPNRRYVIKTTSTGNEWPDWVNVYVNWEYIWGAKGTSSWVSRERTDITDVKCYRYSDSSIVYWNSVSCEILAVDWEPYEPNPTNLVSKMMSDTKSNKTFWAYNGFINKSWYIIKASLSNSNSNLNVYINGILKRSLLSWQTYESPYRSDIDSLSCTITNSSWNLWTAICEIYWNEILPDSNWIKAENPINIISKSIFNIHEFKDYPFKLFMSENESSSLVLKTPYVIKANSNGVWTWNYLDVYINWILRASLTWEQSYMSDIRVDVDSVKCSSRITNMIDSNWFFSCEILSLWKSKDSSNVKIPSAPTMKIAYWEYNWLLDSNQLFFKETVGNSITKNSQNIIKGTLTNASSSDKMSIYINWILKTQITWNWVYTSPIRTDIESVSCFIDKEINSLWKGTCEILSWGDFIQVWTLKWKSFKDWQDITFRPSTFKDINWYTKIYTCWIYEYSPWINHLNCEKFSPSSYEFSELFDVETSLTNNDIYWWYFQEISPWIWVYKLANNNYLEINSSNDSIAIKSSSLYNESNQYNKIVDWDNYLITYSNNSIIIKKNNSTVLTIPFNQKEGALYWWNSEIFGDEFYTCSKSATNSLENYCLKANLLTKEIFYNINSNLYLWNWGNILNWYNLAAISDNGQKKLIIIWN